jgi:hypothetical protein
MPYYRFTFTPHVAEAELLEQYLILLIPFLERFQKYSWTVEKDNTINKHIELIVYNEDPDPKSNFYKKFKTFTFKKFFDSLKNKQTDPAVFLKSTKVKDTPEDLQFCLGYVNKEHCVRKAQKGFSSGEISSAVEYYYLSKHLDKSYLKDGWTLITTKNIHALIEQYTAENNISIDDPQLKLKMTKDKYSFINVSPKIILRTFRELRIVHKKQTYEDTMYNQLEVDGIECGSEFLMNSHCQDFAKFLMDQNIDPDEIPQNIQEIMYRYSS